MTEGEKTPINSIIHVDEANFQSTKYYFGNTGFILSQYKLMGNSWKWHFVPDGVDYSIGIENDDEGDSTRFVKSLMYALNAAYDWYSGLDSSQKPIVATSSTYGKMGRALRQILGLDAVKLKQRHYETSSPYDEDRVECKIDFDVAFSDEFVVQKLKNYKEFIDRHPILMGKPVKVADSFAHD